MSIITYGRGYGLETRTAPVRQPAKGLFTRILDALIQSRMRTAEREIRRHLHLVPQDVLRRAGYRATLSDSNKLPFVK